MIAMRQLRKMVSGLVLVGAFLFGMPLTKAHATLQVEVDIVDGSGTHVVANFSGTNSASQTNQTYTFGTTTFSNVTVTATSNAPGTALNGNLAQTSVSSFGSSGPGTLVVKVVENTAYTQPGAATNLMNLSSQVSRSDQQTDTLTFQSWVKPDATLAGEVSAGLQTYDPAKIVTADPNTKTTTFTRGASYALRNTLTLAAGSGIINVSGTTIVTSAVPAPATLLLGLSGLPIFGIGHWLRRRRQLA